MSNDPYKKLARLERGILALAKDKMQRAPWELSAFVLDRMDFTQSKKRKDGSRYLPPNTGNRLRTLYGNLTRAVTPEEKGNISNVTIEGSTIKVEFGFNPFTSVTQGPRTGDLRYGVLHEYGGTISHPGGTPYFIIGGRAVFTSNEKAKVYEAKHKRTLPRTKAHSINMPARPYLRPGFRDYMKDPKGFTALVNELVRDVIKLIAQS